MNWSSLYPLYFSNKDIESKEKSAQQKCVEFADIGCGYGGLLGMYILTLNIIFIRTIFVLFTCLDKKY